MKKAQKIAVIFLALVIVVIGALIIALATFNIDKYRPQLVDLLSRQTGRAIKLNGPLKLEFSLQGATLIIQDAAIRNPSWASRPDMAGIGHFELGLSLLPLLSHQISITELKIANADIQLETAANGQHNWDMTLSEQAKAEGKATTPSTRAPIAIEADHITVTDSQISLRDKDGKMSIFNTDSMIYGIEGDGVAIHFEGNYDSVPLAFNLKTGTGDLRANKNWAFNLALNYGDYQIKAKGTANLVAKIAAISAYDIATAQSDIHGQFAANWAGGRPIVKGTLISEKLNPADLKAISQTENGDDKPAAGGAVVSSEHVFSDAPLDFDALKSADAALEVNVAETTLGAATLTNVTSQIDLSGGRLDMPFKAILGGDIIGGEIKIDADASPPVVNLAFAAPSVDLADLLHLAGAPAFLSGKANTSVVMAAQGYSLHNLAGSASGKIDLIASGGTISSSAANSLSSGLMELLAPGGGSSNALNCLAVRFIATNGTVRDNGILLDSAVTTVAGKGDFQMGLETISMTLHAKPKLMNTGGLLPPLDIGGTFAHPEFHVDTANILQHVTGILTGGSLSGIADSNVPTVQNVVGQNACSYTLDHPTTATSGSDSPLLPGIVGQAQQKLKGMGGSLLKSLLGQ